LGKDRWEAAFRAGRSLSFSQIGELVSLVLKAVGEGNSVTQESSGAGRGHLLLSKREAEALSLIAEGLTNKEIARRLILTENTVKTHVTSLFNKLAVDSRAQAVAVAAHEGLLDSVTEHASGDD
jgi:DNA-binding NarL/FixJ family response regulator